MKTTYTLLLSALSLVTTSISIIAQDAPGGRPAGGQGGPGGRPGPPLMAALDTNKDGELDASEIANASAALTALDKNSDGKLSGDEIRPARDNRGPGGHGGGTGGPGAQRGQRGGQ